MNDTVAIVRQAVSKLPGVSRTWFEWALEKEHDTKTLVVEVSFDTDPNSPNFDSSAMDDIRHCIVDTLKNTTMIISDVRIVPDLRR